MKRLIALVLGLSLIPMGLAGCADKAKTTTETTVKTPTGESTKTQSTEIKQTGENPPPVR